MSPFASLTRLGLLLTVLGLAAPALAQEPGKAPAGGAGGASPSLSDLGRSLRSYFTEEELELLFQYMRDSVIAAFKGEEVALPPDLAFKLEILLVRMKKEGGHYMDNLIRQLEKDLERNLKEKLKEKLAPPDVSASTYTLPPLPAVAAPAPSWTPPAPSQTPAPSLPAPTFPAPTYPAPTYTLPPLPFFFTPFFQPPPPPADP
jgi:hypothetical protein